MKPLADTPPLNPASISAALRAAGVQVSQNQASRLAAHANLMLAANATMNLTRITDPDAVVALHIVDSLAFVPQVGSIAGRVIDIGSGAGYPGIPLGIVGWQMDLCESVGKKARFLESSIVEMGLPIHVFPLRAEQVAAAHPRAWAGVVARAVSSLASLVELAAPLLEPGGRLIALKAVPSEEELRDGDRAAKICGMGLVECHTYELPDGEKRSAVVYESTAPPRLRLPRRPGLAQHSPLGG